MPQPVQHRGLTLLIPDNDSEWTEYFAHARAHRLVMRKCTACGLMRYPPTHACPWCTYLGWTWNFLIVTVSGFTDAVDPRVHDEDGPRRHVARRPRPSR